MAFMDILGVGHSIAPVGLAIYFYNIEPRTMELGKKIRNSHISPSTHNHCPECEQSSSLSPFDDVKKQATPIVSENMCIASKN